METETTESAPTLSLDDALAAAEAEALATPFPDETGPAEEAPPADEKPAAEAPRAKLEAKPTETVSAKVVKAKMAELTKLEMDLAAKRGELATSEKVHAEKLAKSEKYDALMRGLRDNPGETLQELLGEDMSEITERLAKATLGHDPNARKLTGVEKELADIKAKLDAKEKAEADAAKAKADAEAAQKQFEAAAEAYLADVAADPKRWPALQEVDEQELVRNTDAYMKRMFALTGKKITEAEAADAMEELALKNPEIVARLAKKNGAPAKEGLGAKNTKTSGKTLTPSASAERGTTRELSLDEKLAAAERDAMQQGAA